MMQQSLTLWEKYATDKHQTIACKDNEQQRIYQQNIATL